MKSEEKTLNSTAHISKCSTIISSEKNIMYLFSRALKIGESVPLSSSATGRVDKVMLTAYSYDSISIMFFKS